MPTYDYRCDSNGRVVEVNHRMSEEVANWGDLCARTGTDPGDTPLDAPVKRLATGGHVLTGGGTEHRPGALLPDRLLLRRWLLRSELTGRKRN